MLAPYCRSNLATPTRGGAGWSQEKNYSTVNIHVHAHSSKAIQCTVLGEWSPFGQAQWLKYIYIYMYICIEVVALYLIEMQIYEVLPLRN